MDEKGGPDEEDEHDWAAERRAGLKRTLHSRMISIKRFEHIVRVASDLERERKEHEHDEATD